MRIRSKTQRSNSRRGKMPLGWLSGLMLFSFLAGAYVMYSVFHPALGTVKIDSMSMSSIDTSRKLVNSEKDPPLIDIRGAKSLVINIGSNGDPILPKQSDGPCTATLAVEPVVPHLIREHPQIHVLPAAISDSNALASMYIYNNNGVSSSLSKASQNEGGWSNNIRRGDGKSVVVATLKFETLLRSIPESVEIKYIRTDMQGHDFAAFKKMGDYPVQRGIKYIETETFPFDSDQYEGVNNDLCRDWIPYMKELGYVFEGARVEDDMVKEFIDTKTADETCRDYLTKHPDRTNGPKDTKYYNAMWRLASVPAPPTGSFDAFNYPNLPRKGKRQDAPFRFTDKEYEACLN